jgi:hypothetical protein
MQQTKVNFFGTDFVIKIGMQCMKIESVVHNVDLYRLHPHFNHSETKPPSTQKHWSGKRLQ